MSVEEGRAAPAIRWVRVLLAGFLAEVALIAVAVPLYFLPNRDQALNLAIPPASFLVLVAFGWWVGRSAPRAPVLNGFLAGTVGVVLYVILTAAGAVATHQDFLPSLRPAYLLAHALKMAGGALGGWLAARRAAAAA
jgi:putative membrane protein (TIGR04086 family)